MGFFDNFGSRRQERREEAMLHKQLESQEKSTREQTSSADDNAYFIEQQQRSDLLMWQQDFSKDITDLRARFLGHTKKDGKWARGDAKPMCNETFFDYKVEPLFKSFLERAYANSNLTEKRICDALRRSFNTLAESIRVNHERYGIEFEDASDIMRQIKNVVNGPAFRPINGWLKKTDSTMFKSQDIRHEGLQREKKGLFNIGG